MKNVCDISFAEKVRIFSYDYLKYCNYISGSDAPRYVFTKNLYSKLIATSQILEDFLDFNGAKNNKKWYFYREMSAAVRHLSMGGYSQKHILNRLFFYGLPDIKVFGDEGHKTLNFITTSLMKLAPVIIEEARRLSIPIPDESFDPSDFPGIATTETLDYDIDGGVESKEQQKENIVKITSEFLNIGSHFDLFSFFEPYNIKGILEIVPAKINEVEIRRFEMLVHNLQSYFDTYVIHGGFNCSNQNLKDFRSFFSVIFHLLNMMGRLLHFYERHLHEAGYKDIYKNVQNRLAELIDPEMLLDRTINYGLYYVCHYFSTSRDLVKAILDENAEKTSVKVGIPMNLGFHCRPSLMVAKIVQFYGGKVELRIGEDRFDASSVLDIQWAGGKIQKENIKEVIFEGDARALKDIKTLAGVNYGEDTMGKGISLPDELKYLK